MIALQSDVRVRDPPQPAEVRRAVRQERSRPLVEHLQRWLQDHVSRLPGWSDLAKAIRYALAHWDGLILYFDDRRLEMDTNVVERAIRPVTITRKNSLFAGSVAGAHRWAIANTLIQTCKLNGVETLAYFTDVLQRIISAQSKNHKLHTDAAMELASAIHARHHIAPSPAYRAVAWPRQSSTAVVFARRSDIRFQGARSCLSIPRALRANSGKWM
jgi:Transposase IS66 family/IS66 C-terminal element